MAQSTRLRIFCQEITQLLSTGQTSFQVYDRSVTIIMSKISAISALNGKLLFFYVLSAVVYRLFVCPHLNRPLTQVFLKVMSSNSANRTLQELCLESIEDLTSFLAFPPVNMFTYHFLECKGGGVE